MEGVVPTTFDVVEINGEVTFDQNLTVTALVVQPSGVLQKPSWGNSFFTYLTVQQDVENYGTISATTSPNNLF